jgi:hypothetical protein
MRFLRAILIAGSITGGVLGVHAAGAQPLPPHAPGTICLTPRFWCWAQPPGPTGSNCACPTPYGWVPGVRG